MKKGSSLLTMILSLGLVTVVAAALLAWVYTVTLEPIKVAERSKQVEAIRAVTPKFDNVPTEEVAEITLQGDPAPVSVFPARENGKLVGAAVESYTKDGFSGEFRVMFGFNDAGDVTGFEVLSHAETPGLGAKMNDWFRMEEGKRSVIGKNPATNNLTVAKDGGEIDAITAATITSRAFLDALRRAHAAFIQYRDSQPANN